MCGMLILAVDTTSRTGGLALCRDGRVSNMYIGDGSRTHGERLPGDIRALLADATVTLADVDLYAVVTGPGSFTGLRVGIAAVQGLALAGGRSVVPVPALEAYASTREEERIAVWRDAQRRQVFAAVFERHADQLREVVPAVSLPPAEVAGRWREGAVSPQVFVGDGVEVYREVIQRTWPEARCVTPSPPLAPAAALIACRRPEVAVAPHAIVPIYVRAADAELANQAKHERRTGHDRAGRS